MEKLKNLINPGHKKDDEVLYGSGQSDDPVHTGHGHHTGKVEGNPITSNKTGDDTGPTTGFSGYGNAPAPGSNRAPEDRDLYEGSNTGATGGSSASRMPGEFADDTATTASIKSGIVGEPQSGSTMSGSNVHDPLNTNKALPREPELAGSSYATGSTGVGPHSSSLANKADPRVDSDLDGSKGLGSGTSGTGSGLTGTSLPDRSVGSSGLGQGSTTGSSHLGRDAALGAGALGVGEAAHHHREKQEIGADSGREFPLGGNSTTSASGYPSGSTGAPNEPGFGATTGGYGSGTGPTAGSANQGILGSKPSVGAYNEESWSHDHSHQFGGDPCGGPEAPAPGAPHFIKGPHALETANRLDPHVSGGIGEPTETAMTGAGLGSTSTGTGLGSSSTGTGFGSTSTGNHHVGRDAALAGGVGAAGVGAYESSRGGAVSTTAGPHDSNLLNKADPRVDSDLSQQRGTSTTGTPGLGHGSSTMGPSSGVTDSSIGGTGFPSESTSGSTTGRDHHLGRDAGIAGAGAAGLGAYEAEKHHHGPGLTSTTSGSTSDPYSSSGVDPRSDSTSRSGTTGAGGLAAYEAEKHLGGKHDPSHIGTSSTSTDRGTLGQVVYDSGRGPTTSGYDQPTSGTGLTSSGRDQQPIGSGHHLGRDAGLVGAGGVGAYETDKHLGKHDYSRDAYGADPSSTSTSQSTGHHLGRDAGLVGAGGVGAYEANKHLGKKDHSHDVHGADPSASNTADLTVHRYERDAAPGAGSVGAGAAAGSEFSKTAAEHDAKQELKDQKHHQKEIEKEQKHHQKEVAAAEKKHHEEKKHHGGILGLFKREKPDDELKRENLERKGDIPSSSQGEVPPGFTETRGHPGLSEYEQHERAGEHQGMSEADKLMMAREHDRNRLHKDPPSGYIEQKIEEQGHGHGHGGASAGGYETLPDGRVVEPHTGLPADLNKGAGVGGTDNTPVPGVHGHHH